VSRRKHRGAHEEEAENSERWLLTYADMITLLLALFIVLFAISTVNQKKFLALALGLKQTFNPKPGILPSSNGLLSQASLIQSAGSQMTVSHPSLEQQAESPSTAGLGSTAGTGSVPSAALQKLQKQLTAALKTKGLSAAVTMQLTSRGLVVQVLADKAFFQTGSADLGSQGDAVVDAVASVLSSDNYSVDVEGYTDNQPLNGGPYNSNEELSAVRAVNVVLRLSQVDGINIDRLAATGYGASHPQAPNTTPANMALNRRIDMVVLTSGAQP
jgi:chemotaxis protein MotB